MGFVFVHGLSGSSRWWRDVLPLLGDRKARLLDLPRFGRRFRPLDSVDWLAGELAAEPPAVLVGHSMGGLVCATLAARRPELVRGLVLVSPAGAPVPRSTAAYVTGLARALAVAPLPVIRHLAEDALRTGPEALLYGALFATREQFAGEIGVPTLLVWGEHDHLLPVTLAEAWRKAIPGARGVVIPGTGHVPMVEDPSAFAEALLEFVDDLGDG